MEQETPKSATSAPVAPASVKRSDFSRAFAEDGKLKTHVGGQALLEGIMMRGKYNWAVAVREPDGGIYTEEHDLASGKKKNKWMSWPVVRGCVAMVESLALGYKALEIASLHAFAEEEEEGGAGVSETAENSDAAAEAKDDGISDGFAEKAIAVSMIVGLLMGVVLFVVAPAFLTNLLVGDYDGHTFAWNVVDGIIRVVIFVFYIWLIGRMSDIKRMFAYHGAEHKTIHCFEHGLPLTPENARSFPCLHVRCGTAFLIMVMLIAILVYTIVPLKAFIISCGVTNPALKLVLVIAVRILFMPVIAGLSYEVTVKWAGSHPDNPLVKVILWPGMQMQLLTTNEPDDSMLECAITAMQMVLDRERLEEEREGAREAARG